MKNIVIYAPRKESNIADLLEKEFEDANIRVEEDYTLKEYETLNPSLIITENVTNLPDTLALVKFKTPILFIGEEFKKENIIKIIGFPS